MLDYERIEEFTSPNGVKCYIAIHSTKLGPAFGGCRIMRYDSDSDAMEDAKRLARGMTYKNSLAGLNYGGGKCVVNAPIATPEIMRFIGECIEYMKGSYISGEDIGTNAECMRIIREVTKYVDKSMEKGDDLSSWTSLGVYSCIRTAVEYYYFGKSNLDNISILVEGLGKVGMELVRLLRYSSENITIFVKDINLEKISFAIDKYGCKAYSGEIVNVYSPCAIGGTVNSENGILCDIICGSANNQLKNDDYAHKLHSMEVLYCPDYLVNSGGVIAAAHHYEDRYDPIELNQIIGNLGNKLKLILNSSDIPLIAANKLVEERLK
jgi:leucine dehydrogenase